MKNVQQQISKQNGNEKASMIMTYIIRHHDCEKRFVVRVEGNVERVCLKQHKNTVHDCSGKG